MGLEERILKAKEIMGLSETASIQEIKERFARRAKELHPDLNPQEGDFHQQFIALREAYDLLMEYAFFFPLPLGGEGLKKHLARMDYQERIRRQVYGRLVGELMSSPFDPLALEYDRWFDRHEGFYRSELEAVKSLMPEEPFKGLEIGVGTGRFGACLGIQQGIEISKPMGALAEQRGMEIFYAPADSFSD